MKCPPVQSMPTIWRCDIHERFKSLEQLFATNYRNGAADSWEPLLVLFYFNSL